MKGRPKDPTRTGRRTGHRRKPDEAPKLSVVRLPAEVEPGFAEPPATLHEDMHPTWVRVTELIGKGRLRPEDEFGIEMLVRQYHRAIECGKIVDQYGVVTRREASGDVVPSPFLKAERDATAAFLRLAEHYGLTTASRMRLGLMQLAGRTLAEVLEDKLSGRE